jgi:hypothetical protein
MTDPQLPDLVSTWLGTLYFILVVTVAVWVICKIGSYLYRRAYNLSAVESADGKVAKPDFLKVDHDARRAQINRGEAFETEVVANARKKEEKLSGFASISRVAATLVAVLSSLSAIIFAFMRFEEAWRRLSAWDRLVAIVEAYPLGIALALGVILFVIVKMTMAARSS